MRRARFAPAIAVVTAWAQNPSGASVSVVPNTSDAVPLAASDPTLFDPSSTTAWRALVTRRPRPRWGALASRSTVADIAGSNSTSRAMRDAEASG